MQKKQRKQQQPKQNNVLAEVLVNGHFGLLEIELGTSHREEPKKETITTIRNDREDFLEEFKKEFVAVLPAFPKGQLRQGVVSALMFLRLAEERYRKSYGIR